MSWEHVKSPNVVPVSVVKPYIKRWLDRYKAQSDGNKNTHSNPYVEKSDNEGHLGILSFQCGVSGRVLRQYLNTNLELETTFDIADKIVCATEGPLAWHTDDTLKPFYESLEVTYGELKRGYELPEGFDFDSLPRPKQLVWENARMRREVAA